MQDSELPSRFAIPGVVAFEAAPGGLTRAVLTARGGRAAVMLHGAHVTEFQPAGRRPVLWVSRKSWFEPGKPIRGGVPVCWPWFSGDGPAPDCPGHGVARLLAWQVQSTAALPDGRAALSLRLDSSALTDAMRRWWPHAFELEFTVTVGGELTMELTTRNIGSQPFTITEALHSYFAVSDIRNVRVHGLENRDYLDTVGPPTVRRQDGSPITFAAETDRDYLDHAGECVLEDSGWGRRITIAKDGSRSTVVWNPWIAKAARMPDFGDDEWTGMVCIESANIRAENAVVVPAGAEHVLAARISER
ncbi:MAG: D-hexose-6-phosphate mutarotase [Phycisphaerae bacterium]|nr:D-hexose-6-phosphate mutarotase [Phycisphaerae bacterium]